MEERLQSFDICIVCALYEEARAVIDEFSRRCNVQFTKSFNSLDYYEYRHTVMQNMRGEPLSVLVTWLPEMGPTAMTQEVKSLVRQFHPRFMAMTGMCAGYSARVQLGDLIIASATYHFEEGKTSGESEVLLDVKRDIAAPTSQIIQYARGFDGWKELVREMKCQKLDRELRATEEPRCVIAPMASGMAVRGDNPFARLREKYDRSTIAIDMEACSFYSALVGSFTQALVVKGVSDYADMQKHDDYHDYAARASAVYLLRFIQEYVTQQTIPRRNITDQAELSVVSDAREASEQLEHLVQNFSLLRRQIASYVTLKGPKGFTVESCESQYNKLYEETEEFLAVYLPEYALGNSEGFAETVQRRSVVELQQRSNLFVSFTRPVIPPLAQFEKLAAQIDACIATLELYKQRYFPASKQASDLDTQNRDASIGKAEALYALEQYEEGLNVLSSIHKMSPDLPDAYVYMLESRLYFQLARYQESLTSIEQAIYLNPKDADLYINKANTLEQLRQYEEAAKACEQALYLQPDNPVYHEQLGKNLLQIQRTEDAQAAYEQALQLYRQIRDWKGEEQVFEAMPQLRPQGIEVFMVYDPKDQALRDKLGSQLDILQQQGILNWHDNSHRSLNELINSSSYFNKARIILFLISPDFLDSGDCYELGNRAVRRADQGESLVIPIILRPTYWQDTPFSKFQALPKDAQPINNWGDHDKALNEVIEEIQEAIAYITTKLTKTAPNTIEIFYSYSLADREYVDQLEQTMNSLDFNMPVVNWHSGKILAGQVWDAEIHHHLDSAHIILLLVSPDYLASDYCYSVELARALERQDRGAARVIPVLLHPVNWRRTPFSGLQPLPTNAQPVSLWENASAAFLDIAQGIQEAIQGMQEALTPTRSREASTGPVKVFLSYTREDESLVNDFRKHLTILRKVGLLSEWYDRMIQAGASWREEIESHLESAQIILLFLSPNYLHSEFQYSVEMKRAMEKHEAGEVCVIPILLEPFNHTNAPYEKLQPLPKNSVPVTQWSNRNSAFSDIVTELEAVCEEIYLAGDNWRPINASSPWSVPEGPVKVFCSFADSDEEALSDLETHLSIQRQLGIMTTWHRRMIKPGANIQQEIQTHLNESQAIVLLVSPAYLASGHCRAEMLQALERQRADAVHVIPILVEICEWQETPLRELPFLPESMVPLHDQENRDAALLEIVLGLIDIIQNEKALTHVDKESDEIDKQQGTVWYVPFAHNPYFTGRERELADLYSNLSYAREGLVISGLAGIGKTQLAIEHAYRYGSKYRYVLWIHASTPDVLRTSFVRLASVLNLPIIDNPDQDRIVEAVKHWLQAHDGWLAIFDGADPANVLDYLPDSRSGHILLTTRVHTTDQVFRELPLGGMSEEEGTLLLLRRAGRLDREAPLESVSQTDLDDARIIVKLLDGHPLMLTLIAQNIYPRWGLPEAINFIKTSQLDITRLLEEQGSAEETYSDELMNFLLSQVFQQVEQTNPAAADLLRLGAFLPFDVINEELSLSGSELLPPSLKELSQDSLTIEAAINELARRSLISYDADSRTFSMHPQIKRALQETMSEEATQQWKACAEQLGPAESYRSVQVLMKQMEQYVQARQREDAEKTGQEILNTLPFIKNTSQHLEIIQSLVPLLIDIQQWDLAERAAFSIEDPNSRAKELRIVVVALVQAGLWGSAERLIGSIEDSEQHSLALHEMAFSLVAANEWERAEHTVLAIEQQDKRIAALHELSKALDEAKQGEKGRALRLHAYMLEGQHFPVELSAILMTPRQEALRRIYMLQGNLLDLPVDAIIHSVGSNLGSSGQLGAEIRAKGGLNLARQLSSERSMKPLETLVTDAGKLAARYIIHVSNENSEGSFDTETTLQAVEAALDRAEDMNELATLALTSIGSGVAGLAPELLAPSILQTVAEHLTKSNHVQQVFFVLRDQHIYEVYLNAYQDIIATLLPTRMVYRLTLDVPTQVTVGQNVKVRVTLQLATDGEMEDTFDLPEGIEEIHCFISPSDQGLRIQGSEVQVMQLLAHDRTPPIATFELQARLQGERDYTIELRIEDPNTKRRVIRQTKHTLLVEEPKGMATTLTTMPPLDIRVTFQPSFLLQVDTSLPHGINGPYTLRYRLTTRLPGKQLRNEEVGSVLLTRSDLNRFRDLLHETLRHASNVQPEDMRAQMLTVGAYLFDLLFPPEHCSHFYTIFWDIADAITSFLLTEDGVIWLPWELLAPYRENTTPFFLCERYQMGRWIDGLGPSLAYELPVGGVALATYYQGEISAENVQPFWQWQRLLDDTPISSILNVARPENPVYGLHLLRYADTPGSREIVPRDPANASPTPDDTIQREAGEARFDLRLKRPIVSLSVVSHSDAFQWDEREPQLLDHALPFLRAGASAVLGSWWPTSEEADLIFWPTFYDLLTIQRIPLGEALARARQAVARTLPQRPDWLAYTLFGNPRARPYVPETGEGYATLECLTSDHPLKPGEPCTFRASLRTRPPTWHQNRLLYVTQLPSDVQVVFLAPGLQQEPPGLQKMQLDRSMTMLQAFITLTPPASGTYPLIAQFFQDGEQSNMLHLTFTVDESTRGGYVRG